MNMCLQVPRPQTSEMVTARAREEERERDRVRERERAQKALNGVGANKRKGSEWGWRREGCGDCWGDNGKQNETPWSVYAAFALTSLQTDGRTDGLSERVTDR